MLGVWLMTLFSAFQGDEFDIHSNELEAYNKIRTGSLNPWTIFELFFKTIFRPFYGPFYGQENEFDIHSNELVA